ncbi:MAG: carboxypeptidase-like regulatory domain-containing protein [Vicinamibacterales bacterium]
MMKLTNLLLSLAVLGATACHPGPVLSPKSPANGTIAGMVSTTANAAVPDHKVTAIEVTSGARFDATTGVNGGYTIKLPEGTYRLEIELRPGEMVTKQPADTRVHKSDLDPHRDFTIGVKSPTP